MGLGAELPTWTILPFAGLLLSIALLPLAVPHFWESNRNKALVAALFSAPVVLVPGGSASATRACTSWSRS